MKVINSHYIPLPEPYSILLAPNHRAYVQIGTLAVLEEARRNAGYNVVAHHHPVVMSAVEHHENPINDGKEEVELKFIPWTPNGEVLYKYELGDCAKLCTTDNRRLQLEKLNTMLLMSFISPNQSPLDFDGMFDYLQSCGIRVNFPTGGEQVISLSTVVYDDILYLQSELVGLFFMAPYGKMSKKGKAQADFNSLLLEFVNQARAYLKINPDYHFRFKGSYEGIAAAIDILNTQLNDYLVRPQ